MSKHFKENKKELAYYLTMYKLEGHTTWRTHLSASAEGFTKEQKQWATGKNPPAVTEMKIYRIDRVSGYLEIV